MSETRGEQLIYDLVNAGAGALQTQYPEMPFVAPFFVLGLRLLSDRFRTNLQHVVGMTSELTAGMDGEELAASFQRPTFGRLLDAALPGAMRADTEESRRRFASLLEAGLKTEDAVTERLVAVAKVLEQLDDTAMLWLHVVATPMTMNEADEFFKKHPYLRRKWATMTSSLAEVFEADLSQVNRDSLVRLGLVRARQKRFSSAAKYSRDPGAVLREVVDYLGEQSNDWTRDEELTELGRVVYRVATRGFRGLGLDDGLEQGGTANPAEGERE